MVDSLATLATKSILKKEKMTLRVEKQPGLIKGGLRLPKDLCKPLLKEMVQGRDIGIRTRRITNEVCFKVRKADIVAQVTP